MKSDRLHLDARPTCRPPVRNTSGRSALIELLLLLAEEGDDAQAGDEDDNAELRG